MKKRSAKHHTLKIIVGAGGLPRQGWILTDIDTLNLLKNEDWKEYFAESSIDAILSEHVWEHLTREEGIIAAQNCYKYLKNGGYLRIAVPDGFHPDPTYIAQVKPGGKGFGAHDHKMLYNYQSISEVFESAGFSVDLLEYFDEVGNFHFKEWNPSAGLIRRSKRFDERNKDGILRYTSLILDAKKGNTVHENIHPSH